MKKDLIGKRFGRLIVLSKSEKTDKAGNYYLNCKCDCGNEKEICWISLVYGRTISCGCFRKEQALQATKKLDSGVAADLLYLKYKHQATRRGIFFNLTKEEFTNLVFSNCYYCNELPSNSFNNYRRKNHAKHLIILYNGIDRLDSTKGYEKGNVVSCCKICNYAKRSLSEEQFKSWIKRVYTNLYHKVTDRTPGELVDSLITADIKCFLAQEDMLKENLSDEERVIAGEKSQRYNAKRNSLISSINKVLDYSDDRIIEKTYENK
jgi:hypothetical protein